jgi:hypothetical protein
LFRPDNEIQARVSSGKEICAVKLGKTDGQWQVDVMGLVVDELSTPELM